MQSIDVYYLLNLALKRLWILILTAIVFASIALAYSKLILVPVYSATSQILVTNGGVLTSNPNSTTGQEENNTVSTYDISSSVSLVENVIGILNSSNKFIALSEKLGGSPSYDYLRSHTTFSPNSNKTFFINITFSSNNRQEAVIMANAIAEFACEVVPNDITNAVVTVNSTAMSAAKVSPIVWKNTAIFGGIGLVFAYAVVFIIDMADKSIRGEDEFVSYYDIPLIGSVPDFDSALNISRNNSYYSGKGGYYGGKY